ncbi:MAG TPA: DUF3800 domain-containing protein [Opitutaceae bacterium]|nr:DUF3800 domain-containing protein [Opitutaceae bacterium]
MFLSYFDESGDDGFPSTSSDLFVLAALYMPYTQWRRNFEAVQAARRQLAQAHRFRFDWELHTREFLLEKDPYRCAQFSPEARMEIVGKMCATLASLDTKIVIVVINKKNIRKPDYRVLDTALTYSVQRIHNDLQAQAGHFMVISDEGRIASMRTTIRRLQKINFVPMLGGTDSYRQDLRDLIEDPLPKNSRDSYFIQLADMVACITSLWCVSWLGIGTIPKRMAFLPSDQPKRWLEQIQPVLNLQASKNPFGIVCYPRAIVGPTQSDSP